MTRIAVFGSTNGTSLQPIIDAIKNKKLKKTSIEIIISNRKKAGILERGRRHGLAVMYNPTKGKTREEYDLENLDLLTQFKPNLILLVGYMKILSKKFIDSYKNKIWNVHPSLLPKFAGGMDADVHFQVIKAGERESGCTIHEVNEVLDGGKILIQKKVILEKNETPESLKIKVQKLEGDAFVELLESLERIV